MGRFLYGDMTGEVYRIDDRTLAHLELAIGAQLRLGGAFAFTLESEHVPSGRGRHVLWVHPAIAMQFRYGGDRRTIAINPAWVAGLAASAGGEQGMRIVPEPVAGARAAAIYG